MKNIYLSRLPYNPMITNCFENYLLNNINYNTCYIRTPIKSVVIGKHQIPQIECNLSNMKNDNIQLIRRKSGGGAVYLDEGNTLIGYITENDKYAIPNFLNLLTTTINNVYNVNSEPTGKNDISINGKKVVGMAYNINTKSNMILCHACILINANIDNLSKYLTPNKLKLQKHYVKSVDKRVCNLIDFINNVNNKTDFDNKLLNNCISLCKTDNILDIDLNYILSINEINNNIKIESSDNYIYNDFRTDYNFHFEHQFNWGYIEIFSKFKLKDNNKINIEFININTDCLDINFVDEFKKDFIIFIESSNREVKSNNKKIEQVLYVIEQYYVKANFF